jgi:predicted DNA-binding protein with PD1-like motif
LKYSQGKQGRVFVVRLEDGDILHECVELLARKENIKRAAAIIVGGADKGSKLVVGPGKGRAKKIVPMDLVLGNVYEIAGTGTIFPDKNGIPVLHMHIAGGRQDKSVTGCVRRGVKIWHVGEVIIFEILKTKSFRKKDAATGFELLEP